MKLIVGLGNPGGEYRDTRHNIGFMVVDKLAKELGTESPAWKEDEKLKAMVVKIGDVILAKPITYMNSSGIAVSAIMRFYKLTPSDVWVIHDDMDLPLGKVRIRQKGSSAGHRGVDSIIGELKTDTFVRFRLGVGRGKLFGSGPSDEKIHIEKGDRGREKHSRHHHMIDFILSKFTFGEAGTLKHLIKHGEEAVRIALLDGIDKAMGRFN